MIRTMPKDVPQGVTDWMNGEITILVEHRADMVRFYEQDLLNVLSEEEREKCIKFYKCQLKFIDAKLRLFGQCKNGEIDADSLSNLQEIITDEIESKWEFLGMKYIERDSDIVKKEFEFIKMICSNFRVKPKKKTRRGGRPQIIKEGTET